MYNNYNTPEELNNLTFSIWDADNPYGHALFAGNLMETSYYLENNSIEYLEVSGLDLQNMESYQPVTAERWLDWYYLVALSVLEETSVDQINQFSTTLATEVEW
ncbi:hypothetical protein [Fodinibius salsisoli]|uniref:Uncharacterized protein n=1 Tax=Fodinibius salsisoli TaxID=2820877 RepID=A0ABT3PIS7_9BACT|nr:hypothetical protein [Fodinibius salsisoli]MCW9705840.1 hypothetical protein [Fodinibius salsisoli]